MVRPGEWAYYPYGQKDKWQYFGETSNQNCQLGSKQRAVFKKGKF